MHRLGDAERAAVGHAAGRLVGVHAIHGDMRGLHVVRAGGDAVQAGRELGRVGRRVGRAVVGQRLHAQPGDVAVFVGRHLGGDVVVARKRVGLQVLAAILDPLDRPAGDNAGDRAADIAGVDRHLAAEAAADIGRDDLDLLLGDAADQREHGAVGVRGLRGHIDPQLAGDFAVVGDHAAGLDRRDVDARNVHILLDHRRRLIEHLIGRRLVAGLPVPDVIGLLGLVVADDHLILERLERVDHHRQRLVIDDDMLDRVGGDVALGGDDDADLLRVVDHLLDRQHHLRVGHQRGHPVQVAGLFQILAGDHRQHAGDLQRLAGVDLEDFCVGVRAAHDIHIQHARQLHIVDIVALALDKARVFLALHAVAHAADRCRRGHAHIVGGLDRGRAAGRRGRVILGAVGQMARAIAIFALIKRDEGIFLVAHTVTSSCGCACSFSAAYWIASTILT